jgi:hypothetical protein
MSTRIASKGAIVKYAATATPTNVIPGVRSVATTIGSRAMIDATCHDDSSTKNLIPAPLRDTVSLDITIAHDPANAHHEAIRAAHIAGTLHYVAVVLPDAGAAQWEVSGYWTDFGLPALNPDTGLMECVLKFKANAVETFTQ